MSHVEGLIPKEFGADAIEVPGARKLLSDLDKAKAPWAIVVRHSAHRWTVARKVADDKIC